MTRFIYLAMLTLGIGCAGDKGGDSGTADDGSTGDDGGTARTAETVAAGAARRCRKGVGTSPARPSG
jgi:hypothetical protein